MSEQRREWLNFSRTISSNFPLARHPHSRQRRVIFSHFLHDDDDDSFPPSSWCVGSLLRLATTVMCICGDSSLLCGVKRGRTFSEKRKTRRQFQFHGIASLTQKWDRDFLCVFHEIFLLCVTRRQIPRVVSKSSAQLSRLKSIACCSKDRTPEQKNKIGSERAKRNLIDRESLPPVIFLLSNISREWKIIKIQAPIKIEKYLIFLSQKRQKRTDQHVVVDSAFFVSLVLLFQLIGIESLRVLDSPQRCVASS